MYHGCVDTEGMQRRASKPKRCSPNVWDGQRWFRAAYKRAMQEFGYSGAEDVWLVEHPFSYEPKARQGEHERWQLRLMR